jgi:TPR repeat protein
VRWYRLAAEQGDAAAQYNVGVMYAKGQGVPQDFTEAVRWYRLAAAQGIATAQYNLGALYANGQGVPQDYVQAHMWLSLATEQGDKMASDARDLVAAKMSSAQIEKAKRLAREWKPTK